MRIVTTLALIVFTPCAVLAQTATDTGSSHFEGWPLSSQWGANKQSFEATINFIRPSLVLLTVAENGFGRRRAFSDSVSSFTRWEEVSAWCAAPETLLVRTSDAEQPVIYENIKPDDLTAIVDTYFRVYAATAEPIGPEIACNRAAVSLFDESKRMEAQRRVIELLEAASSESE